MTNRSPRYTVAIVTLLLTIVSGQSSGAQEKVSSDRPLFSLKGHDRWVAAVAFSGDGKRIASGAGDDVLRIWDASKGTEILSLRGHGKGVTCLADTEQKNRASFEREGGASWGSSDRLEGAARTGGAARHASQSAE